METGTDYSQWKQRREFSRQLEALASSTMTSDAFSLIMYTAQAMNDPGMRGNTDASTTRRLRVPCTLKRESTTAVGSLSGPNLLVPQA